MEQSNKNLATKDSFAGAVPYEAYMARWSRLVAREFIQWLNIKPGKRWLDIGCGTGALASTILEQAAPGEVVGIDASPAYINFAREHIQNPYVRFEEGSAAALPFGDATFDIVVSGLVLNFLPDKSKVLSEMIRVTRPGGIIALYVWDYSDKMELLRYFWDAAVSCEPGASLADEGRRFPICRREPLLMLFANSGLRCSKLKGIEVPTDFSNFNEYWMPFLGGQGPAGEYAIFLTESARETLRQRLLETLPIEDDGSIHLTARAWAVKGTKPIR